MRASLRAALVASVAAASTAVAQPAGPKVTGPIATYWVSAQTQSGFGMPGMGGQGRPSAGAMMRMMMGGGMGGQGPQHLLTLQLGSSKKAAGEPSAEHLPPAGLGVGQSLPLVTPVQQPVHEEAERPAIPQEYQRPRGRMLIFWGCGEHAKPGQPLVIDFSQLTPDGIKAGKVPPALAALGKGFAVTRGQPPSPGRNATYGEWPNAKTTRVAVPGDGSLVGDHLVRGDYTPDIRFALGPNQDFLAALQVTANAHTPAGASELGWRAVPNAQGYLATAIGGGQNETAVLWTSSEVQASAFSLPDYIGPADLARLVASHALMGPQTTHCTVPKEVVDAAPAAFFQLVAYGPEANFVYPPKPADPKAVWNRQWEVKVRYRSATSGLLGQTLGGMAGASGDDEDHPRRHGSRGQPEEQPRESPGRSIMRGLGAGLIPGF